MPGDPTSYPFTIPAALTVATYGGNLLVIKYPVIPWLAISILGWIFGRHLIRFAAGLSTVSGRNVLWACGVLSLIVFAVVRGINGYGSMFLPRSENSWQQWLHVSKYPPSLTYDGLELGIAALLLAGVMRITRTSVPRLRDFSPTPPRKKKIKPV